MYKKFIILTISTLLSGFCMAQNTMKDILNSSKYTDKQDRVTDLYLKGKWALNIEGNVVKAGMFFAGVVTIDSMHAPTHYEIAGMIRDPKKALKHIERAVEVDSTNITYLYLLSSLYADSGDVDKAIEVGEKILSLDNKSQRNYMYLISLKAINKEPKKALDLLDSVKVKFGESDEYIDYRAEVMGMMAATPELIAQIKEMINTMPEDSGLKLLLANKYASIGQDTLAEGLYNEILASEPNDIRATAAMFDLYNARGDKERVIELLPTIFESRDIIVGAKLEMFVNLLAKDEYYQTKHLDKMIGFAKSLSEQYPDNYDAIKIYAQELLFAQRETEALEIMKSCVQKGVGGASAILAVIDLEIRLKNINSAIEYCDMALSKYPEDRAMLISTKVYILSISNMEKKAIDILKAEIKTTKDSTYRSFLYTAMGDTYSMILDNKKAATNYKKAVAFNKQNIVALNNYAYLLAEGERELELALSMSLSVVDKEPSNPTYLDTYAWVLYKMGRYEEAKKAMSKAIALDTTNNAILLLHYGDILDKLGQRVVAEKYWKKALEAGADIAEIEKRVIKK